MLDIIFYTSCTFTVLLGLGLYITNIVFSFKYKDYEFENAQIISYIHNTLNSKFIYEFNPRTNCISGEEQLTLGTWDGTRNKCKCGDIINNFECSELDKNCKTIKGVAPKNFTVFNSKAICVVRKGETYLNLVKSGKIIPKDVNCSETDKSCGIVDTLNRKLCVKKEESCPLNKASMDKEYLTEYLNKINLDDENVKHFLNEENDEDRILSIIKLSDGLPCLNISEKNWKAYNPEEKVLSQTCTPINGKTTDDRYEKFENFETKKAKLYKDNGLAKYVTSDLESDETPINLYGTTFIGLEVGEEGFDYDKLISIQNLSNKCNKVMVIFSYIMLGVLISPIIGCVNGCAAGNSSSKGIECVMVTFFVIAGVVIVIGFLVDFILCIIIYISVQRIEWRLSNTSNIGDEATNAMMNEVLEKYSSNYSFALAIIIVLVLFICFAITSIVTYLKKKEE